MQPDKNNIDRVDIESLKQKAQEESLHIQRGGGILSREESSIINLAKNDLYSAVEIACDMVNSAAKNGKHEYYVASHCFYQFNYLLKEALAANKYENAVLAADRMIDIHRSLYTFWTRDTLERLGDCRRADREQVLNENPYHDNSTLMHRIRDDLVVVLTASLVENNTVLARKAVGTLKKSGFPNADKCAAIVNDWAEGKRSKMDLHARDCTQGLTA